MQPSGSNELCASSKVSAGCCGSQAATSSVQTMAASCRCADQRRPAGSAGQLLSYGGLKGHAGVDVSSGRRATMAAGWYLALERRRSAGILVFWVDPWVNVVMGQAKPKPRNNFDG